MQWLWIVLGAIVLLVALVAVVGALLPLGHVASRSAVIAVAPEPIWETLTTIDDYCSWRADLKSVERLPDHDGHVAWRETGSWGTITFERIELEPNRRIVTRIVDTGEGFGGTWTYELQPESGGTRVTITERGEVYNIFFRFLSRFVFGHTSTLDTYLKHIGAKFKQTVSPADAPVTGG